MLDLKFSTDHLLPQSGALHSPNSSGLLKKNKFVAIEFDSTYEIPPIYQTQDYILFSNNNLAPELTKWYLLVSIENTKGKHLLLACKEKEVIWLLSYFFVFS